MQHVILHAKIIWCCCGRGDITHKCILLKNSVCVIRVCVRLYVCCVCMCSQQPVIDAVIHYHARFVCFTTQCTPCTTDLLHVPKLTKLILRSHFKQAITNTNKKFFFHNFSVIFFCSEFKLNQLK